LDTSITVYIGSATDVDSTTGFPLQPGSAYTFEGHAAKARVFAIAASGTPAVAVLQELN